MIYFVRHRGSTANAGGVTMPHLEIPLSDLGRRQAALATLLEHGVECDDARTLIALRGISFFAQFDNAGQRREPKVAIST